MRTLRKNVTVAAAAPMMITFAGYGAAANENAAVTHPATRHGRAAKLALVAAAPILGLAFVVAFPVIGLAVLAWMAYRALGGRWMAIGRFVKNVALFLLAPVIGLAYALAFPFVGIGMLVWKGANGMTARR